MRRYWVIEPYPLEYGEEEWNKAWRFDLHNGVISIGWGTDRDPSRYNKQQLRAEIEREYSDKPPRGIALISGMVWKFYHEIKTGDIVVARRGRKGIAAVGTVASAEGTPAKAAYYDCKKSREVQAEVQAREAFANFVNVRWHDTPRDRAFGRMVFGRQTLHEIPESRYRELIGLDNSNPEAEDFNEPPDRVQSTTYRILRDTATSRAIKELHDFKCQVCNGAPLELADGTPYAEAHHLKPLGSPHGGPDAPGNIICVCPNCHVLLDYFAIPLVSSRLGSEPSHRVKQEYVQYHNRNHRSKCRPNL